MKNRVNSPIKNQKITKSPGRFTRLDVHPSWATLIQYCKELKYGELTCIQIQDGLPASVEYVKKKLKLL